MGTEDQKPQNDDGQLGGSALRAMARAGGEQRAARVMSLAKALRLTTAKVADDLFDMAMAVIGARMQCIAGDDLSEVFDPGALMILLDGPMRRRGAALLDGDLVGALIQQQTMGKVGKPLGDAPRKLTDTDAAICAPFLNALIERAAPLPDDAGDKALMDCFAFGARVPDTRLLLMALEAAEYQVITLTLDIAGGTRQGVLQLCFPIVETTGPDGPGGGCDEDAEPATMGLERQVLALNVDLNVALSRISMPLAELRDLGVGAVLDLGITAFDHAIVQTRDGRGLGRGTLGQINGVRALQLEHAEQSQRQPRRRASDRAELDLPRVEGDGTGTQPQEHLPVVEEEAAAPGIGELAAMPDMSDLPELDELPDMSDRPGFDGADLPKLNTG